MKKVLLVAAAAVSLVLAGTASRSYADSVTGTYTPGDSTVVNGDGTWTLTATNSTDSFVTFTPDQSFTFSQLATLSADFVSTTAAGGGSPRISVGLETGSGEAFLHIFLGTSPDYTDNTAGLNAYSGVNVIGNNDAGRYDDSQFAGGSPFTTYDNTNALVGNLHVDEIDFVVDTFGTFGNRNITLDGLNASVATAAPLPSAGTMGLGMLAVIGAAGMLRKKLRIA
jgi:hypothetical protein